jgi:ElaB/YqjD/DUF883 family membrane-anchored ribosome-binding protein
MGIMSKRRTATAEETVRQIADEAGGVAAAEIAALRAKVEQLMTDHVTPALANAAGRAEHAAESAVAGLRNQADRISGQVQEKPMAALGLAALAGFVVALIIRR